MLRLDTLTDAQRRAFPCAVCRVFDRDLGRLSGVRLGSRERMVLLQAGPTGTERVAVPKQPGESRAAREAHLRAVRRLEALGLVVASGSFGRSRRHHLRRTPLGNGVVAACGDALRRGARVRWQTVADVIAAHRRHGDALLDAALQSVQHALGFVGFRRSLITVAPGRRAPEAHARLADEHDELMVLHDALQSVRRRDDGNIPTGVALEGSAP